MQIWILKEPEKLYRSHFNSYACNFSFEELPLIILLEIIHFMRIGGYHPLYLLLLFLDHRLCFTLCMFWVFSSHFFYFLKHVYLFWERKCEHKLGRGKRERRKRESQVGSSLSAQSPTQGLNPRTTRPWPVPKSRIWRLTNWDTQATQQSFLLKYYSFKSDFHINWLFLFFILGVLIIHLYPNLYLFAKTVCLLKCQTQTRK